MSDVSAREGSASRSERQGGHPARAILLKVASTLALAVCVTCIKLLDERVPLGQIVFARAFLGLPPILLWLYWRGGLTCALRTRDPGGHLLRGLIGGFGMLAWFFAVQRLPLAEAQAIAFAGPLAAVVLATLVLRERVGAYRWSGVVTGFGGILLILSAPILAGSGGGRDVSGLAAALIFALLTALASIQIRRLTGSERTGTIVVYFSIVTSLFGLATFPLGWVVPDRFDALLLLLIGLSGSAAQLLLTQSLRHAEASFVAPFDYTSMIWVIAAGILVFGETPTLPVLAGSGIVIGAGVFVLFRERRAGSERRARVRARRWTQDPMTGMDDPAASRADSQGEAPRGSNADPSR